MSSSSPAYHLRPNKAVERMLFIELLRRLDRRLRMPIAAYTYVGLGGPYLEDFNLLHATLGNSHMISLETDRHVFRRQELNLPCSRVEAKLQSTRKFIDGYQGGRTPLLIWFDYSKPHWKDQMAECCDLLSKLPPMSIFKVTFSASTKSLGEVTTDTSLKVRVDALTKLFADFGPYQEQDIRKDSFPSTLYRIFRKAIQDAVPDTKRRCIRSLASYRYDDGTPILTITCVVGPISEIEFLIEETQLSKWFFSDINWHGPTKIVVPHLSFRERLAIDQLLPDASARTVMNKLKLWLAEDRREALEAMDSYVQLHRHVPQFLRVNAY